MSDALLNALAESLADLVTTIDTCDDDVLDPDTAVKWLESTGYLLARLPPTDRRALSALVRRAAARQPDGAWREDLLRIPESFGLDDDQHELYCDAVEQLARRFVETVRDVDPGTPVPSCPGWTFADLVRHHGTTHRWMEHLVRTRAAERVWSRDVPLDLPDDPAAYPQWLAAGAEATLRTLRTVDPETPMWSHGADQRVRFFPRRLLFEAVVHLADAELALGLEPRIPASTAADGIEEFLENLPYYSWIAEPVGAMADGSVRLTAADTGAAWTITFGGGSFAWTRSAGEAAAGVEATAGDLLLLVYGRVPADDERYGITGDRAVLDAWLAASAF
ncbi:maleylpyruvate isomerase family mycothiol-dependent enzyme [Streptomyces lunaelactis]|uniref:maleylpyruvate isomerase family mycothiol-dependent enzyme n=1 Tax=Streptomyces lunaelactis TaxID=1535768 RepID=UPI001584D178|nr:maleylpyruvate isomerase family mycothiol-dependent enzyme [Streptomyces lunaelactis]NUK24598.1 maleylpyruvate isomerase family mycothiol-dependent enzyme [Streptomyces lunaelactis]NUK33032.1 maleylpyruvate isomerase family mycothiol-dependent enzyme [Streptomyces lunaelactis]NUK40435.1 maleylpyruvate isomerase family mycothiol-dependent enzyme [Streptomyces lunaelactis]NUK93349.1 maleylpyruvate isomerase family mycothiol-dependent enzyme [Streptomyces lunaelactis]NUL29163.1 maleylpyruvate 